MSLSQVILAATTSAPPPPAPSFWIGASGSYDENNVLYLIVNYSNAILNSTVHWAIVGDTAWNPGHEADVHADITSTNGLAGAINVSGSGSFTLTTITNVADHTTEGTEYYAICLGSSPGGSDIYYGGGFNVNDTSQGTNPMPGGSGAPYTASYLGIFYTLTPSTNGSGSPGTAYPGDVITWTITSSSAAAGQTVFWWVDGDRVAPSTWVENTNNGAVTLNGSGAGTFTRTVANTVSTHNLFRMYVGMALYQGFLTHGFIGV